MDDQKNERTFYHDVLNLASSLRGISEVICDVDAPTRTEMLSLINTLSETLIETINARRLYRSMESNDLKLTVSLIDCETLLSRTAASYRKHTLCQNKSIELIPSEHPSHPTPLHLLTDKDVLQGALGYGLRTALETVKSGQTITLSVTAEDASEPPAVLFSISFPGSVSDAEKQDVFKNPNHLRPAMTGLSAYVFHTLVTRYLNGRVNWTTHGSSLLLTARFNQHLDTP